ncbi:MAG: FecR domain-containing protein [Planctomycetota bacterium]|nr:FecR domain-containing protein [Planctomycetota bacterium]
MKGKQTRWAGLSVVVSAASLILCGVANGQGHLPAKPDHKETTPAEPAPEQVGPRVPRLVEALPDGQTKRLQALVIDVQGRAQWRPSDKAPWKNAKVNDLLDPGAGIRTGLRSSITMRVGKNATILVGRSTRLDLPQILQEGAVLRTRAAVRRGRADFKVDLVGLTNDFAVLTPTTTLAVRGTGFAVKWGGLEGVEIEALASNVIHAIEVQYLLTRLRYYLSGQAVSREGRPDPVEAALGKTVSRPISGALSETELLAELQSERAVDYSRIGLESTVALVSSFEPPPMDEPNGMPPEGFLLAMLVCDNLHEFFFAYQNVLDSELGFDSLIQVFLFSQLVDEIQAFCEQLEQFDGNPFQNILNQVTAFCHTYSSSPEVELCISLFHDLVQGFADDDL